MQLDAFGKAEASRSIAVRLYADEIQPYGNALGEQWMYIGVLAIPEIRYKDVLGWLREDRDAAGYDGELHFVELRNYSYAHVYNQKTLLAKRWVERVLWDGRKTFHFYLLGLNLSNLEHQAFGTGKSQKRRIYNRFFRASVAYVLKSFFRTTGVFVHYIFHDSGPMECDELFDWHTIWRLQQTEEGLTFLTDNIHFINSDHNRELAFPDDSHLIQLCDVLIGGLTQCLDARNKKDGCCEIAQCLLPLVERLTDPKRVRNPNSRYRYVGRISLSFFPSKKLTLKELEDVQLRARSHFYIARRALLGDRWSGQLRLF